MTKQINIKQMVLDATTFTFLVGTALVIATRPNEDDLLNLSRNAIVTLTLFCLGLVLAHFLARAEVMTLGRKLFGDKARVNATADSWWRSWWGWHGAVTLLVLFAVGVRVTELSITELFDEDGFRSAKNLFLGLASPDFRLLPIAVVKLIETVFIALIATLLAIPVAFFLAFFSAKNLMTSPWTFSVYALLRTTLNVVRSVEPVIWAIIFSVWVGVGPFAGMLALMVQSIASLTKQYSELIESVDKGPVEGITATGANAVQVVWFAIVPQVVLPYISFTIYRWDINVRMATIIGFAGGGGIGNILYQYSNRALWPEVGCLILAIAAVVWLLDLASAYVREALK